MSICINPILITNMVIKGEMWQGVINQKPGMNTHTIYKIDNE